MPHLESLYISGNLIAGTIPNVNVSGSLKSLRLSYNQLTGTIPSNIQRHTWKILDLSYNKLKGHLSSDLFEDPLESESSNASDDDNGNSDSDTDNDSDGNQVLYLDVNRLSGYIPSSIKSLLSINILNDNLFFCALTRKQLPKHDPKYELHVSMKHYWDGYSLI
jgi:hypothetical protein